eukprot:CAMPEP_0197685390 /NCGR_PEP_ID=MMETSP1338-20131121/100875_1 /TAXON_ID=43686 ORGANISM="Pelagodinium beii, Strain RCC1491" /NCGR_SAMPLE_ID=MMETSP1338 /ASSEMBLY_ACC=CAM_ASM_000754 /LENGTH=52 /DNA_ID=CAMNT_0043267205 /DNA_START=195 /DNA_END=353 /DNA_ORIENTATION=-
MGARKPVSATVAMPMPMDLIESSSFSIRLMLPSKSNLSMRQAIPSPKMDKPE